MKLLHPLLISILAASSVSARRHRLCCCAGFDACGQFVCDSDITQSVVNDSKNRFVRSTRTWDKDTGSPIGGLKNWMYASDHDHGDDHWLGGNEISKLCGKKYRKSSRCFTPRGEYKNENTVGKLAEGGGRGGGFAGEGGGVRGGGGGKGGEAPEGKGGMVEGGEADGTPPDPVRGPFRKPYGGDKNHWPLCPAI